MRKQIATKLLEHRVVNFSSFIPAGLLEPDELAEAIRLRWVEGTPETDGRLHVTHQLGKIEEMENSRDELGQGDTVTVGEDGESYTGTVHSIDKDGVRVSFGTGTDTAGNVKKTPKKAQGGVALYRPEELQRVAQPKFVAPPGQQATDRQHQMFGYARQMMGGAAPTSGSGGPGAFGLSR